MDMDKQNINHHAGRYVRPRVRLIRLEDATQLLMSSGGGNTPDGSQANNAHGTVLGSSGGSSVSGGIFSYGGVISSIDFAD